MAKPPSRQDVQDRQYRNPSFLQKLEMEARRNNLQRASQESYNWFIRRASRLGSNQTRDKIKKDAQRKNRYIERDPGIGNMYMYSYDAKWKDELPYWDAFPLIIMVGPADGGWHGLNFHYLPPRARATLFDRLQDIATNKRYDRTTRLKISYETLKDAAKYRMFKPCFKHYLNERVTGRPIKIGSEEWEAALFLPIAQWRKANAQKVYADSIKAATGN